MTQAIGTVDSLTTRANAPIDLLAYRNKRMAQARLESLRRQETPEEAARANEQCEELMFEGAENIRA